MPWFKVDDSFYDHPKVFDAPDCALALWVRAGCWSARNLTNGFVPANLPARLCDDPDTAVRELVDRGLWRRTKGGHLFHDWTTYQPEANEVLELRAKRAEAGRKGGLASGKARSKPGSKTEASASGVAKQNRTPTRPDPTYKNNPPNPPRGERGSRRIEEDPEFAKFWEVYPRKVGKGNARRAWTSARKKTDPSEIIRAAEQYRDNHGHRDPTFIAHPTTWLNGERWNDEPPQAPPPSSGAWWNN